MNLEGIIEAMVRRVAAEVARETVRSEMARAHGDSLITREEACQILSVGKTTLSDLVRRGVLQQINIGRAARFRRSDVGAAVDALARKPTSPAESPRSAALRLTSRRAS